MSSSGFIRILNTSENNLKSVSLEIPRNKLVVITGVSGSGKSSLAFDVIYREAENRFLASFSANALQFLGKRKSPDVEKIDGLSPAIPVSQKSVSNNPRSTVGTITEIYDYLRLLYARVGQTDKTEPAFVIDRSLLSFNTVKGACPVCKGSGVEDSPDPDLLVADASKSIRDRALVITAPNGYIIYSQVTMDVLDQVCRSEGFSVDIPWKELTPAQKNIILFGSNKLEIPFGKHTLESRMRWTGITAKPREMGYYKGIIPVMETILKRERNKNILRFVRTRRCNVCNGARLNENALSVKVGGKNIAELSSLQLDKLKEFLNRVCFRDIQKKIAAPVIEQINIRIDLLARLGLSYLTAGRESSSLSGGESQRLRLVNQLTSGLRNVLYVFDEPSIGLHPADTQKLIGILKELRDSGNSIIVTEHDEEFIRNADWIVDIGQGAGVNGGEILFNGPSSDIARLPSEIIIRSRTLSFLNNYESIPVPSLRRSGVGEILVKGASANNLKNIDVAFKLKALNVITGVSGAGKSSLAEDVLGKFLKKILNNEENGTIPCDSVNGYSSVRKIIDIDASPIGRTPRSNPATYTGLSDKVRDLFATQPLSVSKGYNKSRFSFNTKGGRCESCEGAGYIEVGMHFMGNAEIVCEKCEGKRFDPDTLGILYHGKNIYEVLDLYIDESLIFFKDQPAILRFLEPMSKLGLGYLKLGQRSTTLSGGEAQRIKLAAELASTQSVHTLYILDEPTTGLHQADVKVLLDALITLIDQGNTVILTEHHQGIIAAADHVIDLGPGSGNEGGFVVASGTPELIAATPGSLTGLALKKYLTPGGQANANKDDEAITSGKDSLTSPKSIQFSKVSTNNLRNISFNIPDKKITVVTGVSGSGKSSLAFDTIFSEGRNRFMESFSAYARTRLGMKDRPDFEEVYALTPTLAIDQRITGSNPRSTVGTMTGIYDLYRLLYSRVGHSESQASPVLSSLFSFNHQHGACPACDGLGYITVCDPMKLVTHPQKSLLAGALDGTRTGKFYGDPFGQYISTLKAAGISRGIDYSTTWSLLSGDNKKIAMYGTGDEVFSVKWEYRRNKREGEHHFKGTWKGFAALVNEEYLRKHADHRGKEMMDVMKNEKCHLCNGARLSQASLSFHVQGVSISQLSALTVTMSLNLFKDPSFFNNEPSLQAIASPLIKDVIRRLGLLDDLGLSYLTIDRESRTLSGGEARRVQLAAQCGSALTGITYVLDEPTMGLHPADVKRMMRTVTSLQEQGNTVVIVEHDRDVIRASDHIIDLGPGAGLTGGKILAEGSPLEISQNRNSVTGPFLLARKFMPQGSDKALVSGIKIRGACVNNLKKFNLDIPSGGIIAVTGVSGSGKSSLVMDIISKSHLSGIPEGCESISWTSNFEQVRSVSQHAGFSSSAGTAVTFSGIFDKIRELFSRSEEAIRRNLGKNHFSYLNKEGQCPQCQGAGIIRVSMDFISDATLICETCKGQRYNPEVLSCHLNNKTIAEVLGLSFSEAGLFFKDSKQLSSQLSFFDEVGLGYLQLGQTLDTLSGGESQRLALATELMRPVKGKILYILEEPSTGLHFIDIQHLNKLFRKITDRGNTILITEHDPEIILNSDWVIDLGPGGGDLGGRVIFSGRVRDIMTHPESATGQGLVRYHNV